MIRKIFQKIRAFFLGSKKTADNANAQNQSASIRSYFPKGIPPHLFGINYRPNQRKRRKLQAQL